MTITDEQNKAVAVRYCELTGNNPNDGDVLDLLEARCRLVAQAIRDVMGSDDDGG